MKRTGGSGMIAALILACLFATTMLLTLVMGARVYRGVQARVEASAEGRVQAGFRCRILAAWMRSCWHRIMMESAM